MRVSEGRRGRVGVEYGGGGEGRKAEERVGTYDEMGIDGCGDEDFLKGA